MTVCIAAVCESGKNIVLAADRMYSIPSINIEIESPESKIEQIIGTCTVLTAGDISAANEVIREAKSEISRQGITEILHIAEQVKQSYISVRAKRIRENVVNPFLGADFDKFEKIGLSLPQYLQLQPNSYQQLQNLMSQYNLGIELVVTGFENQDSYIAYIGHPGTMNWREKQGYIAIGQGAIHALTKLSLDLQTCKASLAETLFRVFASKKAAEVAPGVGKAIDIAILSNNRVFILTDHLMEILTDTFNESSTKNQPSLDQLIAEMKVLYSHT